MHENADIAVAGARSLLLPGRGVVAVGGAEARSFLQGMVSNDVDRVAADRAVYAVLLSPQGRFLHDLFIAGDGERLLLDCEAPRRDDLIRRLTLYRLRAKATIEDVSDDLAVALLFGDAALARAGLGDEPGAARAFASGIAFVDPRAPALGARAILPRAEAEAALASAGFEPGSPADYDRLRLALGVPDGSRDLPVEKALPMESRLEELNALDWEKGCYVGQELTARMKYRALIKKRLAAVRVEGPLPPAGTPVLQDGKQVGEIRSGAEGYALALLRNDALKAGAPLAAGEATLTPLAPPD